MMLYKMLTTAAASADVWPDNAGVYNNFFLRLSSKIQK
jgi:hypothetical protein